MQDQNENFNGDAKNAEHPSPKLRWIHQPQFETLLPTEAAYVQQSSEWQSFGSVE